MTISYTSYSKMNKMQCGKVLQVEKMINKLEEV